MEPILIAFFTLLPFIIAFVILLRRASNAANLPPSPPRLPVLGNLLQIGELPHRSLHSLSKRYGPIILLQFGSTPTVVVSSADLAEKVMKTHDLIFASRPPSSISDRLLYNSSDVAFSPYGELWRQKKKICVLHLLSSKRVQSFRRVREEEAALLLSSIRSSSSPSTSSITPVNLSEKLMNFTNDIICRTAMGRKFSGQKRIQETLKELVELLGSFSMADYVPWLGWVDWLSGLDARVKRTSEKLDELLEQIMEVHLSRDREEEEEEEEVGGGGGGGRGEEEGADFVDVLLSLRESDAANALHGVAVKALVLDMFAAGTDTTFSVIEWAMAELIKHPNWMHMVQEEIRRTAHVVSFKEIVEEEDINKMIFLKAVVKEALRLHVPVPLLVPRLAMEDTNLHGYDIPAGTRIMINAWAIARDPSYWDNSEEFNPQRFLESSDVDFKGQHFHFTPFGAGRRACPGIGYAMAAVECALANLLYHFEWELPEEMEEEELDMTELPGITVHKKINLILIAKSHVSFN